MRKFASIASFIAMLFGIGRMASQVVTQLPDEEAPMPDNIAQDNATAATTSDEAVLAKLKSILQTVGHDVDAVWDEAVALAKKAA